MGNLPILSTDADVPPWEKPGAVRRDCAPHRAELLWFLAAVNCIAALVLLTLPCFGLLALPAAGAAYCLARRDLAELAGGRMDPDGQPGVERALDFAVVGLWLGLANLAFTAWWFGWVLGD